jgi:hypothetical protein
MRIFNEITDALYIRIVLLLASSLLAVLSVISPALFMEACKKIGDRA